MTRARIGATDGHRERAVEAMAECECHTLPVLQDGRLLGLVTMDNLGEYLLIQAAVKHNDPQASMPKSEPRQIAA